MARATASKLSPFKACTLCIPGLGSYDLSTSAPCKTACEGKGATWARARRKVLPTEEATSPLAQWVLNEPKRARQHAAASCGSGDLTQQARQHHGRQRKLTRPATPGTRDTSPPVQPGAVTRTVAMPRH
jgi:hypothetical protein